jgi:hypothetical protein
MLSVAKKKVKLSWMRCVTETPKECNTSNGEIEKLIRTGVVDFETGLAYATNPGNLRLELADFQSPQA